MGGGGEVCPDVLAACQEGPSELLHKLKKSCTVMHWKGKVLGKMKMGEKQRVGNVCTSQSLAMSGRFLLVGSAEEARRLRICSVVEANTCVTWEESRGRQRVALIADNSQILLPSPGCQ